MVGEEKLVVFEGKQIRRMWYDEQWYFSVVDVVEVLADSVNPRDYWFKMKIRVKSEDKLELSTICRQLKLKASDGKMRETDCANTESLFRIIQSISSPKAEPFKRWLAKVGYERVREIENPELAQERAKEYYELKGYPKDWIDKRLRGIAIRQGLTDEWKQRGIEEKKEYAILTNEISKATFGVSIKNHKEIKGLDPKFKNQNLRDSMNDWELILTMLGEKATTDIAISKDSQGFEECKASAIEGGTIAKNTRKEIEQKIGRSVISSDNFITSANRAKKKPEAKIKILKHH